MTPAEQAAVVAFPELQRLIDLRDSGWTFLTPFVANGHIDQVQAYRSWPDGHVDVIRIRSTTDAAAMRTDGQQPVGILWQEDGGLSDVVDKLLALPIPGTRTGGTRRSPDDRSDDGRSWGRGHREPVEPGT